jgi:hypothetical protein
MRLLPVQGRHKRGMAADGRARGVPRDFVAVNRVVV